MIKEYAELLADDPRYAAKAAKVSALTRDLSQVLMECANLERLLEVKPGKIAFHSPCTLQHGLRLAGVTEALLQRLGFTLTSVPCGPPLLRFGRGVFPLAAKSCP
jgi:glycolate oxidase iron-sulfur subunit